MTEKATATGNIACPTTKSNLDIIKECDNFPYHNPSNPFFFTNPLASIYQFHLLDDPTPHGWLLASIASKMLWTPDFIINHHSMPKTITLHPSSLSHDQLDLSKTCTTILNDILEQARSKKLFKILEAWTNHKSPILTARFPLSIERSATLLFGLVSHSIHLIIYTSGPSGLKFWIPRRSSSGNSKSYTGKGKLDTSFKTSCSATELPFETLVHHVAGKNPWCAEKLAPETLDPKKRLFDGYLSWFHALKDTSSEKENSEPGLLRPCVQYVYDLEVSETALLQSIKPMNPKDNDAEAEAKAEFHLYSTQEVQTALAAGDFKPSAAMVFFDFFVRHEVLTFENEKDFEELKSRLHRRLPF